MVSDLIHQTQLKICGYQYVHKDSPDRRGVDVALLYQPQQFQLIQTQFLKVDLGAELKTRDILHATGLISNGDTLHIFVNHWPSRYGGELESQPKRNKAAQTLRTCIDSLFNTSPFSKIVIMGDFNDYPTDKSMEKLCSEGKLRNLMKGKKGGTYRYRGEWGILDQFLVSERLLKKKGSIRTSFRKAQILYHDFLLVEDEKYGGEKPFRTYNGMKYQGGFSDHLPVSLDLEISIRGGKGYCSE